MSLTRAQWTDMWFEIKKIERAAANLGDVKKAVILKSVSKMKELVESVVGQME